MRIRKANEDDGWKEGRKDADSRRFVMGWN